MLLKFFLVIIFTITFLINANGQNKNCPDSVVYHISNFGNGIEQITLPLKFKITSDSIMLRNDAPDDIPSLMDVSFKILSKGCQWNNDFSEGMSLYQVVLNDPKNPKKAIINIRINNKKGKIQLLYENSEPRIFNIKE
jgi:hypothetical protein